MPRINAWMLVLMLCLIPAVALADRCEPLGKPWSAVRDAWRSSREYPASEALLDAARAESHAAAMAKLDTEQLSRQIEYLRVSQAAAALGLLTLFAALGGMLRGAWRLPTVALLVSVVSLALSYMGERSWHITASHADIRSVPNGTAPVLGRVPAGSLGHCMSSDSDHLFCLWHGSDEVQGWIEQRVVQTFDLRCQQL